MKRNHKLVIITVSLLAISSTLSAQSPSMKGFSADCIKYMSYYQEDYKAKKYDAVLPDGSQTVLLVPDSQNGSGGLTREYIKVLLLK